MSSSDNGNSTYVVRPLETGNDFLRISVFAKQKLKSAGFEVKSSRDQKSEKVLETEGFGKSLSDRLLDEIEKMDYRDPAEAYRKEPSRIMGLNGISRNRYLKLLEKL